MPVENPTHTLLTQVAEKYRQNSWVNTLLIEILSPRLNLHWKYGSGRYFIASATKLATTAIILQLIDAGKISLDTFAISVLGQETMSGLHLFKGKDFANRITIRHLLAHTSGLADYFEQKQADGSSLGAVILENRDQSWDFDDILDLNRNRLKPRFAPGTGRKAFYSDTNFQLLGRTVEMVTGRSFEKNLAERILNPLGLNDTFMFSAQTIERYDSIATMHSGDLPLKIPLAMSSFGCDGGIVSTTAEGISFLRAFMESRLFAPRWLPQLQDWRRIFFPLEYGIGLMRFRLPRILTLFRKTPAFIGHSGASGAFLFYVPESDLYLAGTVNQVKKRDLPFRLMLELAMAVK